MSDPKIPTIAAIIVVILILNGINFVLYYDKVFAPLLRRIRQFRRAITISRAVLPPLSADTRAWKRTVMILLVGEVVITLGALAIGKRPESQPAPAMVRQPAAPQRLPWMVPVPSGSSITPAFRASTGEDPGENWRLRAERRQTQRGEQAHSDPLLTYAEALEKYGNPDFRLGSGPSCDWIYQYADGVLHISFDLRQGDGQTGAGRESFRRYPPGSPETQGTRGGGGPR